MSERRNFPIKLPGNKKLLTIEAVWKLLSKTEGVPPQPIRTLFYEVERAYSEPHRHYHTLRHVHAMLELLKSEQFLNSTLFWATLYHDYFYDPLRSDNEERSAEIAIEHLSLLNLESGQIEIISNLIKATKTHKQSSQTPEIEQAFLDADMSVLGASPEVYDLYAANVRREFEVFPDEVYIPGRVVFLEKVLSMDSIFSLPVFKTKFEDMARVNIRHEIESLMLKPG